MRCFFAKASHKLVKTMQVGISTASLFGRMNTEDSLAFLAKNDVPTVEVFLESYCEYNREFGRILKGCKGNSKVHSIHTLTTQFEPQLYSLNVRAQQDSFKLLDMTMQAANEIGAKYYTFHGPARIKRTPIVINFDRIADITNRIMQVTGKYGVTLAFENVHWCYYNYVGFFQELKKRTAGLKSTLDIKQARQSGVDVYDLVKEMGDSIVTVHLSDIDNNGKMCLPGRGVTDFKQLFTRLKDVGFDGALLLEVYQNDYKEYKELFDSYNFVLDTANSVFEK